MKETIIKFGSKEYRVESDFKEKYNQVVIYELKGDTPSPIILGNDLKSACRIWFLNLDDISKICQEFEIWALENKIILKDKDFKEVETLFEEFINSLDEDQLFTHLAPNENFTYVNWNEIDEVM